MGYKTIINRVGAIHELPLLREDTIGCRWLQGCTILKLVIVPECKNDGLSLDLLIPRGWGEQVHSL